MRCLLNKYYLIAILFILTLSPAPAYSGYDEVFCSYCGIKSPADKVFCSECRTMLPSKDDLKNSKIYMIIDEMLQDTALPVPKYSMTEPAEKSAQLNSGLFENNLKLMQEAGSTGIKDTRIDSRLVSELTVADLRNIIKETVKEELAYSFKETSQDRKVDSPARVDKRDNIDDAEKSQPEKEEKKAENDTDAVIAERISKIAAGSVISIVVLFLLIGVF